MSRSILSWTLWSAGFDKNTLLLSTNTEEHALFIRSTRNAATWRDAAYERLYAVTRIFFICSSHLSRPQDFRRKHKSTRRTPYCDTIDIAQRGHLFSPEFPPRATLVFLHDTTDRRQPLLAPPLIRRKASARPNPANPRPPTQRVVARCGR